MRKRRRVCGMGRRSGIGKSYRLKSVMSYLFLRTLEACFNWVGWILQFEMRMSSSSDFCFRSVIVKWGVMFETWMRMGKMAIFFRKIPA